MSRFVRSSGDLLPLLRSDGGVLYHCFVKARVVGLGRLPVHPYPLMYVVVAVRLGGAIVGLVRVDRSSEFCVYRRLLCFAFEDSRSKGVRPFSYPCLYVEGRPNASFLVATGAGLLRALSW